MKVYATERGARRVVTSFRKTNPELHDIGIRIIEEGTFGIEALLPSGATDTLRTRLEDLGFRTVRGQEGPAEDVQFTKKQLADWLAYEIVRLSGAINMFDATRGCRLSGLTEEEYFFCIDNYSALKQAVKGGTDGTS